MVWQVAKVVSIPVIGIGGITTVEDALEFLIAGATAIQVGTANFFQPTAAEEIIRGMNKFVMDNNLLSIREEINTLELNG